MIEDALRHLRRDKAFAALIRRVGPPRIGIHRRRSPYEALMRAIAHQQLHGRAALAILARFEALYPADSFPAPELVLASSEAELRACGFSGVKDRRDAGNLCGGLGRYRSDAARLSAAFG